MLNSKYTADWAKNELSHPSSALEKAIADYVNGTNYPQKDQLFRYMYDAVTARNVEPLTVPDHLPEDLAYNTDRKVFALGEHISRRNSIINELNFVCKHIGDEPAVLINVILRNYGRNHLVSAMFPNLRMIYVNPLPWEGTYKYVFPCVSRVIYDGAEKTITEETAVRALETVLGDSISRVFFLRANMSDEVARAIAKVFGARKVFYTSTYRTSVFADFSNLDKEAAKQIPFPDTSDLMWNMAQQYTWCRLMQPKYACLKMRFPFYDESPSQFDTLLANEQFRVAFDRANTEINGIGAIDYAGLVRRRAIEFFDGDLQLRVWTFRGSTETSLFTPCLTTKDYGSYTAYENKMFLYNRVYRKFMHCDNPNADTSVGFDCCNDCALENKILSEWESKYSTNPLVSPLVPKTAREMAKFLDENEEGDPLMNYFHGRFHKPRDAGEFSALVKTYNLLKDSDAERARFDRVYTKMAVMPISIHNKTVYGAADFGDPSENDKGDFGD